ncbi:putative chloramphenical resistance permease RarD (plasmid) [Tsukamurella tyrosinosolvens]|uniref:Chloramphenicol-sensitive protein RarD n=2 Tax=Tsukamurella tyrosinosolvens TaxID=57704 RepID=A0A1H4MEP5_TSUTY|nr:EamA family transporter RarD [Tsukamurella tyrosinosolvens]RDB48684.1 EamA family transporter RarD [Tsukamurella tyrosinosolvens]SEB81499.1 chloramphenicol-sensitive protein RarD [Tsukamurella tyrosinosolvens]VEI00995.1 putative chloramphenical resistance permease RarD [Tsukamurella tyrosinosolvens]
MPERDVSEVTRGTAMGVAAYLLWGLFPLYFDALKPTGPWEILAHRILWTLVLCGAALLILRDLGWIRPVLRQPRLLAGVTIAALLISTNWIVYIVAVTSGHTSDAALGYFLNPLVTVALGVVVLRERLRPLQWVAVGIGVLAFVYLAVVAGTFPVTALALAFSFGLYGLVKNKVGVHLNALQGLTLETAILAPIAAAVLVGIAVWGGGLDFARHGAGHAALLAFAGVATAVPLLLFAAAARRIPLVTVGLIQFATPIMQLLCAVLFLGEHVSPERWIGFGIVWVALTLLTVDTVVTLRRARAGRLAA